MPKISYLRFSDLRKRSGLTIKEVADLSGYNPRTVYRWENGELRPRQLVLEMLNQNSAGASNGNERFSFIDLFAGIGGMRRAFEPLGGKCVFTSEWNEYARQTYLANYSCDHEVAGDITKIPAKDIPRHDLLLAGFPCQPFSIAGVSKKNSLSRPHGFRCEAQGTLFFDVARIIEYHNPKVFLLENVKNLVNHDKGRTFKVIHKTVTEELGYNVHYRIIDARSWTPQHRERIFIIGFKEKNDFDFQKMLIPDPFAAPKLKNILHLQDGTETLKPNRRYIDQKTGKILSKYTLSKKLWDYLQAYAQKHKDKGNGFGFGLFGPDDVARTLSARYYKDGSEILIKQSRKNPRRLTPRECSRLMGFDNPGESSFVIPVSDTQAYKQFGNAVVVPVVKAVAKLMAPFINDVKKANAREHVSEERLVAVG